MAGVIDRKGWVEILSDAYLDAQDYDMTVKSVAESLATRVMAAIEDGAEWEYRCKLLSISSNIEHDWVLVDPDHECGGIRERRRKAGPWVAIEKGGDE